MKSFKEYLIESKQTYEFKIKVVGDQDQDAAEKIKSALERFNVESLSEGKRTPIQETQADFPTHKNVNVTIFDAVLAYPVTGLQIQNLVAEALNLSHSCIRVRTLKEQEEEEINHAHDEKSGKALLGTDYENADNQDMVGDKHVMSLLKELSKTKHQGEQYKGINDQILAKNPPSEKSTTVKVDKTVSKVSAVGSKTIDKPSVEDIGK